MDSLLKRDPQTPLFRDVDDFRLPELLDPLLCHLRAQADCFALARLCSEVARDLEHEIGRLGKAPEIRARRPEVGRDEAAHCPVI